MTSHVDHNFKNISQRRKIRFKIDCKVFMYLLRNGRIKRRRQKDIKFDAARKLSQCAINGVSCGGVGCKRDEPNTFCSKEN